jgi:formylglycine-generating enzyme required for sulfatase activity/tRNA A-37 threonylcarbamoyl transferase component Bud32
MDAEKRQRAKEIFNAALQLNPDERLPFIRAKCGADGELFSEVESLLSYLDRAESFLERPAVEEIAEDAETEKNIFDKLPPPRQIGPYTLLKKLGRGGFGEVWLAEKQTKFVTKKLAVKLPLQNQVDAEAVRNEATLWEKASGHPNVLPIIDADEYDGQIVIVSEYAPDGSLADLLKRQGRLSVEKAIEMIDGILAGLEYLHSRNIVHRDLKPDNVLLQGETPRLADFGISRVLRTTMTSASVNLAGTPFYMAPEAFDKKRNEQTDIWSAGVMFYEILMGKRPFEDDNLINLVSSIATKEPAPLPDYIPQWLTEVIGKSLAKNPENRYQKVSEMRSHLRHLARMPDTQKIIDVPETKPNAKNEIDTEEINNSPTLKTTPFFQNRGKFLVFSGLSLFTLFILLLSAIGIGEIIRRFYFPTPTPSVSPTKTPIPTTGIGKKMEFALIRAGSFMMGSPDDEKDTTEDEKPQHQVTLSKDFYLSKYEVTQGQWKAIMGDNPSFFKDCGDDCPVENVSWDEVQEFIRRLKAKGEGTYRLPTEAEWEYACRAGTTGNYAGNLDDLGWYYNNAGDQKLSGEWDAAKLKSNNNRTHEVGKKQPNAWGLYDMHGNVWEWVQDWFGKYPEGAVTDPTGGISGSHRIFRGGSLGFPAEDIRSAKRAYYIPTERNANVGFRLVRENTGENQNINTNEPANSSKNSNIISDTPKTPIPPSISGVYRSKIGQLKITDDSKSLSFQIEVGMPGCVGDLSGKAKWISETVAEYQSKNNELYCRLTFIFNGKKVTVKENGCDEAHGASCNFEGTYTR